MRIEAAGGGFIQTSGMRLSVRRGRVVVSGRRLWHSPDASFVLIRRRQPWLWPLAIGIAVIGAAVLAALVVMAQ